MVNVIDGAFLPKYLTSKSWLPFFEKSSIIDIWQRLIYPSDNHGNTWTFQKERHSAFYYKTA